MFRLGFVLICCIVWSCGDKKEETKEEEKGFSYEGFSKLFSSASLPYQLTDIELVKTKDTTVIRSPEFAKLVPDSVKNKIFSKGSKIKYSPLVKIQEPEAETYFLVKASSGNKKAALLLIFDAAGNYTTTFPFLIPDDETATSQSSSMDKSYTISRNTVRRKNGDIIAEGKNVFVYNSDAKNFTLIMTDLLDEQSADVINPIDTLPRTRKFAGDYGKGKRNIVSIRDGRTTNQAIAFVHLEKNEGECVGELKGEILFTSSTRAIYRQGGDPCVLEFSFTSSSVSLKEVEGCGNHRGINCTLEGSFSKKKEPRTSAKKTKKK
jgi:hypothetical protein